MDFRSAVEKLEIVECDLEKQDTIVPALGNASVVICCIGASEKEVLDITGPYRIDYQATKNLIDAGKCLLVCIFHELGSFQKFYDLSSSFFPKKDRQLPVIIQGHMWVIYLIYMLKLESFFLMGQQLWQKLTTLSWLHRWEQIKLDFLLLFSSEFLLFSRTKVFLHNIYMLHFPIDWNEDLVFLFFSYYLLHILVCFGGF